jgi:diadenosine tetraphosphatase ApaH/serine/threonine PP2A family protein phosphatase
VAPIGILYDIHGNCSALAAVLADAHAAGADGFILGGDYALFGPFPAETVAVVEELADARLIRGNVDRWSAHPDEAPDDQLIGDAIAACREALGGAAISKLDALPETLAVERTLYCHASPVSDIRSFSPEAAPDDDELLGGAREQRVVFGHTHIQFRRTRLDGVELVNPGSVGMPFDGDPRAAYALLHADGSIEDRRIAYDHEEAAAAMIERFGDVPWARRSADRLMRSRA